MSFFENQNEKKYCEQCGETMIAVTEVWTIELKAPGSGGLGLLKKNQAFILCKKCFMENVQQLENRIIKKRGK